MKVRSDFVTNSSSSNTASLRIKCKPLAEMLDNYRKAVEEAGLGEFPAFPRWKELEFDPGDGTVRWYWDEYGGGDDPEYSVPEALDKVLDRLCWELVSETSWLQESGESPAPVAPLVRSIIENKDGIESKIESVDWDFSNMVRGEFIGYVDDPKARDEIAQHGYGSYDVRFSYDRKTGRTSYDRGWKAGF